MEKAAKQHNFAMRIRTRVGFLYTAR